MHGKRSLRCISLGLFFALAPFFVLRGTPEDLTRFSRHLPWSELRYPATREILRCIFDRLSGLPAPQPDRTPVEVLHIPEDYFYNPIARVVPNKIRGLTQWDRYIPELPLVIPDSPFHGFHSLWRLFVTDLVVHALKDAYGWPRDFTQPVATAFTTYVNVHCGFEGYGWDFAVLKGFDDGSGIHMWVVERLYRGDSVAEVLSGLRELNRSSKLRQMQREAMTIRMPRFQAMYGRRELGVASARIWVAEYLDPEAIRSEWVTPVLWIYYRLSAQYPELPEKQGPLRTVPVFGARPLDRRPFYMDAPQKRVVGLRRVFSEYPAVDLWAPIIDREWSLPPMMLEEVIRFLRARGIQPVWCGEDLPPGVVPYVVWHRKGRKLLLTA